MEKELVEVKNQEENDKNEDKEQNQIQIKTKNELLILEQVDFEIININLTTDSNTDIHSKIL